VPFESLFTKVKFLDGLRVTYVCFGECHSAAITAQGHAVIWGSNIYSQRGKLRVSQNKPNLLQLPGYSKAQVLNYYIFEPIFFKKRRSIINVLKIKQNNILIRLIRLSTVGQRTH